MEENKRTNKDAWVDFVICFLFGGFGVHKFRQQKVGLGIVYLLTAGIFYIGWIVDAIKHLIAAVKGERLNSYEAVSISKPKKAVAKASKTKNAVPDVPVFTYTPTKKVGDYFVVNENDKTWAVPTGIFKKTVQPGAVHKYSEIVSFELLEDGNSITKGGLGRAVAGGLLFGGVGAIVGGSTGSKKTKGVCTKLQIKITLNNMAAPTVYVDLISTSTKKDSFIYSAAYSSAQEILSVLQIICDQRESQNNTQPESQTSTTVISVPEEIKKYKDLLDMGAITEEEFESKKKELLNN